MAHGNKVKTSANTCELRVPAFPRGLLVLAGTGLLLSLASSLSQDQKGLADQPRFHPTRLIAKFSARERTTSRAQALKQSGLRVRGQLRGLPRVVVLDLEGEKEVKAVSALGLADREKRLLARAAALRDTGLFEYVEPDYIRTINAEPTDTAFIDGTLWALRNTGQSNGVAGADIGAVAAWDITTGSTNVIVAVIDTGIRYTHQELAAQMWRNPGESGGGKETNGIDDDDDGYIDNVYGINAIYGTNSVAGGNPMDDNGHGTHVAGTIGASANDGNPHVGVAWNVRLMACKAFDAEGGNATYKAYVSDTTECISFAVAKGATIINASWGFPAFSQTEFDAIRAARDHGVLFVAAAGNEALNNDTATFRSYPASPDLENIISVAAVDRSDNLASFSNFGRVRVHLGAPGVDIYSAWFTSDSAYKSIDGTSMATPHVVGAAALVLSRFPDATVTELRRRILNGAVPIPSLTNKTVTGGRLNVFNSLVAAPTATLEVEVFPPAGQSLIGGRAATLSAVVTDLLPVTNATVTASLAAFTNLTLLDGGILPDAIQNDGVYTATVVVPTDLTTLQVTLLASAPGWLSVTNLFTYPVVSLPSNDDFANRVAISPSDCLTTVNGANFNASREAEEPEHVGWPIGRSAWWSWAAPFNGSVKISTAGSDFDTLLAVYTGQTLSNLTVVGANDDAGGRDLYSTVRFDAVAETEYRIAVDGYALSQGQIVLGVLPMASSTPLAEALDGPSLTWTSGGDATWLGQSCAAHDGSDAARSGPIEAYGHSWMETTVIGPGTLTFWWKVSSEGGYDYLRFSLSGEEQTKIAGEMDWQQQRSWLGTGTNTLRWAYTKDRDVSRGQDAGWVDEISFAAAASAIPLRLGDLDGDGQPTVLDLTLLIGSLGDTNSLLPQVAVFADVSGDGVTDSSDIPALADAILGRAALRSVLDSDGDGLPDVLEPLLGLNPATTNTLANGIADRDRDFDMDGFSNARELQLGTDPLRPDTDGDGWWDEAEITGGSSPPDPKSRPHVMVLSTPPASFVLPANEGPAGLANSTVVAVPPVALVLPANEGTGGLALNIIVASPPLALALPVNEGPGGLTNNTVVAAPPVALVLPANEGTGGLALNTTVASPPLALVLPVSQGAGGLTNNTVIALPPVRMKIPTP